MKHLVSLLLLAGSVPASAEVVSASQNGFEIRHSIEVGVRPEAALAAFGRIGAWWDPEHTYSGKSENLRLTLVPGGCFCEAFPAGGGIEHMHVVYVDPGKRIVLTGSLGPLLYEATSGVLDIRVQSAASGSKLTLDYRAAGFARGGADKLAPLVDQVLGGQVARFGAFVTAKR